MDRIKPWIFRGGLGLAAAALGLDWVLTKWVQSHPSPKTLSSPSQPSLRLTLTYSFSLCAERASSNDRPSLWTHIPDFGLERRFDALFEAPFVKEDELEKVEEALV